MWAAIVALVLGIGSRAVDLLPFELSWLGNVGSWWLLGAFVIGRQAVDRREAAWLGAAALVAATVLYYVFRAAGTNITWSYLSTVGVLWVVLSFGGGTLYGGLGWVHKNESSVRRTVAAAALAGAFTSEALAQSLRPHGRASAAVVAFVAGLCVLMLTTASWTSRARAGAIAFAFSIPGAIMLLVGRAMVGAVRG